MSAPRGFGPQLEMFAKGSICLAILLGFFAPAFAAFGQNAIGGSVQDDATQHEHVHGESITRLKDLLDEAERNNPQIRAAQQGWDAAK
jgi:hypothetical protein